MIDGGPLGYEGCGRSQEKAATIHRNEKARSFVEKVLKEVKAGGRSVSCDSRYYRRIDEAPRLEQQISDWETKKNRFG